MVYEGLNFTDEWVRSVSLEKFLAELEINQHWWENDPKRKEKAKEVYFLINPKAKAGVKAPAAAKSNNDVHGAASNDQ